ncbi:hypothetical protein ACIOC2_19425 [Streptomyces sp. NPDC088337]|uniref:hypothetical protein n=1 Tax=unclassified Streptomyces TaxID=2593676 RepID=UPI00381210F5
MGAVRLRNLGEAVHLYAPPGSPQSLPVDAGQVITVAGPMTETDDAYVCGADGHERAFPKSQWAVEAPPARAKKTAAAAVAAEEKGGDS